MARGKVVLSTSPSGFSVSVDGVLRRFSTPYTASLPAGSHSFLLKKSGFEDWSFSYTVKDNVQKTFTHTGVSSTAPPTEPPILPPTVEEPAFLRIDSTPAGANVFIDNVFTGQQTWTARIEVSPGTHNIKVSGIEGFAETQATATAIAGQTVSLNIPLAPIPLEEPPPTPEPEEPPELPPFSPFAQLLEHVLGEVPGWWKPIDDFTRWATENFGMDFASQMSAEDKALFESQGLSTKILFIGGPMSIQSVGVSTAGKQILNLTAKDILARGLKDPKGLASTIKSVPKEDIARLFGQLMREPAGRDAIQTIQRVVLDQTATKAIKPILIAIGGGLFTIYQASHTLNFLGFLGEEAIQTAGIGLFTLMSNKNWKEAADLLPKFRAQVDAVVAQVDGLAAIPILNFWLAQWWPQTKAAAYSQIEAYDTTIKAGLAVEETGSIGITTNPTGASVFVDGQLFKFPSNTVIDKLVPGNYEVTLDLEEHVTHTETVEVKEGMQTELQHEFVAIPPEPTPGSGQLQVAVYDHKTGSAIAGTLFINDNAEKFHLHSYALDLEPGTYEIRIEEIGYKDWLDTVAVTKDEITKVRAELEKIPDLPPEPEPDDNGLPPEDEIDTKTGRLEITANTPAQIFLGGTDQGVKTPASFDLTQGIYSVTLQAEGFVSRSTTTLIKTGETSNVSLELQAIDAPPTTQRLAKVSIQSEPSSAKILVNGVWTKKYTPDSVLLETGGYEIALTKSGFQTWRTPLRLVEES